MRKLGIGRPSKRPRPTTENIQNIAASETISSIASPVVDIDPVRLQAAVIGTQAAHTQSQGRNILHSTAVGSPSKRIALVDPLDSDEDEIIPASPVSAAHASFLGRSQLRVIPQNQNVAVVNQGPSLIKKNLPPPAAPSQSQPVVQSQRKVRKAPIVISRSSGYPEFSNVLQEHGYILSTPPARNFLQKSELLFRKELSNWIDDRLKEEPQGVMNEGMKFIASMRTYLSVHSNLRHSMSPTQHPDYVPQRSLLHNLLCIPSLQPHILEILFPSLAEACYAAGQENQETVDILVAIIHQLRWIPKIVDADKFVSTILDFVNSGTAVAKKQLISNLPEIIPENKHRKIADTLRVLLDKQHQDAEVIPAVMECFSSLDVPPNEWMKVHEAAFRQLLNAPLSDFPSYLGFLFRTEDVVLLTETIDKMRQKLEITPLGNDPKSAVHMIEIVEKIRFCAAVNTQLIPIWVKQVKYDLEAKEDIRSIDLIMLLIFAEYAKPPITTLSRLFSNKELGINLFNNLLEHNLPILNQVFKTLLNICCLAIRGKETHAVMEHILINLFVRLSLIESQEIAFRLSTFLMESTAAIREASLRVLTQLAIQNPTRLLHFSSHLMSIVASVMRYPAVQIKQLMNVLAMLANVDGSRTSEGFASELAIFLRKQLTHFSDSTRCFGVLGSLATVKQLCQKPSNKGSNNNEEKIKEFIDLVWTLVEREEDACLLFFDELSEVAEFMPDSICKRYEVIMSRKFQDHWTTSVPRTGTRNTKSDMSIRLSESFDANRELHENEYLCISFQEKPLGMSQLVVPSHLRVVGRLVSAQKQGDLSDIDAILGCPVMIPDVGTYYMDVKKLSECSYDQRRKLGRYLLLSINFFRESISAFIRQADPELRIKIWLRLANVAFLQQLLVKNYTRFPDLPKAYIEEVNVTHRFGMGGISKQKLGGEKKTVPKQKPKPVKSNNKSKAGTSKKKKDDDDDEHEPSTKKTKRAKGKDNEPESSFNKTKRTAKEKDLEPNNKDTELENLIQPKFITPYLRWFDIKVFGQLLKSPLSEDAEVEFSRIAQNIATSPGEKLEEVAKLTPETLSMLLVEMNQQTKDPNNPFDVIDVRNIIPSLCLHLDTIKSFYDKNQISSEDENRFESCFRLLLQTFRLVLERVQCGQVENQEEVFRRIIQKVAIRIPNPTNVNETNFSDTLKNVVTYFANFSQSVKTPQTAVEHLLLLKYLDDLAKDELNTSSPLEYAAKTYLKKNWKLTSAQVETILKTWLKKAENPLDVMRELTQSLIPNDGTDFCDEVPYNDEYKSCSKTNFHVWYSTLLSNLACHVYKYGKKMITTEEIFDFWNTSFVILKDLSLVTQQFRNHSFLLPLLKHTRQFFEAVSFHCVKKLPLLINANIEAAKKLVKILQQQTRKIQAICSHSKVTKDMSLLKFVPLLRKVLEVLVFRVRETLASLAITDAFELGTLKNKNIDGELMNSQPFVASESDSNDEDDDDEEEGRTSSYQQANGSDTEDELITNAACLASTSRHVQESDVVDLDEDEDNDNDSTCTS